MPAPKWLETPEEQFANGGKPFIPKPTSKTTDKSSSSRKVNNVQASTDTATRNNTESAYYKFKQAMQEKGITSTQYAILKRYFLNSDAKAQSAIATMPKSVLAILITNQLNKEKPTKPNNSEPAGSSNSNDSPVNDFTSTVTWHKRIKGISESDFNYIVAYHNGNESRAKNMVMTCKESTLRNFIKLGKEKDLAPAPKPGGKSEFTSMIGTEPESSYFAVGSQGEDKNKFTRPELISVARYSDVDMLMEYYNVERVTAEDMLDFLSQSELDEFKEKIKGIPFVPNLFQGNYSGNNYEISSLHYGVDADNDDKEKPTIGNNGCALISTVMAIASLDGYDDVNYYDHVLEARDYALGNNDSGEIYKYDGGTSISFVQDFAEEYKLTSYSTNSIKEAQYALENGGVLVVNVESGDDDMFTTGGGHYLTITGINGDGTWKVNNPNRIGYNAYESGEDSFTQEEIEEHLKSVTDRNAIVVIREDPLTFEDNIRRLINQDTFYVEIP